MAVPKSDALVAAEIHALRQMADTVAMQTKTFGDAMAANTRSLERAVEKLDEVNERLIRVEEQKYGKAIEGIEGKIGEILTRIDALESIRDKQSGAKALIDWLRATTPWLISLFLGALAFSGWKQPG